MTDRPKFGKRPSVNQGRKLNQAPIVRPHLAGQVSRAGDRADRWCECSVVSAHPVPGEPALVREGVVLDASQSGARIRFRGRGALPQQVTVKASRLGLNRRGRVVWQKAFDVGIAFDA